jgi:hypothetical protein
MLEPKLTEVLKGVVTLRDALDAMSGMELVIQEPDLSYTPIRTTEEFVILEECNDSRRQALHPYGTNILYMVRETKVQEFE